MREKDITYYYIVDQVRMLVKRNQSVKATAKMLNVTTNAIHRFMRGKHLRSTSFFKILKKLKLAKMLVEGTGTPLTDHQRGVIRMTSQGMSRKEIAYTLKCSTKTIDVDPKLIELKVGTSNVALLTRYAIASGILRDNAVRYNANGVSKEDPRTLT